MHWSSNDFSFGTPPPPCGQIHRQVSKYYLPAVLRMRAVITEGWGRYCFHRCVSVHRRQEVLWITGPWSLVPGPFPGGSTPGLRSFLRWSECPVLILARSDAKILSKNQVNDLCGVAKLESKFNSPAHLVCKDVPVVKLAMSKCFLSCACGCQLRQPKLMPLNQAQSREEK